LDKDFQASQQHVKSKLPMVPSAEIPEENKFKSQGFDSAAMASLAEAAAEESVAEAMAVKREFDLESSVAQKRAKKDKEKEGPSFSALISTLSNSIEARTQSTTNKSNVAMKKEAFDTALEALKTTQQLSGMSQEKFGEEVVALYQAHYGKRD
jgi:hypothetical protein